MVKLNWVAVCVFMVLPRFVVADTPPPVWVGVAKIDVTPDAPVVLAGYGGRTRPFESIDTRLWARAIVIGRENPVALVVLDNCGITRDITEQVRTRLERSGFRRSHVNVATTHTHNAPTLTGYAPIVWQGRVNDQEIMATDKYTRMVIDRMCQAVEKALQARQPMRLFWGQGTCTFGGNRRVITGDKWAGFGFQMDAPVDHSLPTLIARDQQGVVRAIWANYACHCTTVGSRNTVGGDWAGFANESLENFFPHAISLISIGCGADIGPQPSGSIELARKHGRTLAEEVRRLVNANQLTSLPSRPNVKTISVELPLEEPKPKSYWEKLAQSRGFEQQLAIRMLETLDSKGKIPNVVSYPITVWDFGQPLAIVFMPGEVVVDYAIRLKSELDWKRVWINGWTNRMPGYIPSRKVLLQGGYEADFSQVYYGQPGRYLPEVEDRIVSAVRKLVGPGFAKESESESFPLGRIPSRKDLTLAEFQNELEGLSNQEALRLLQEIERWVDKAVPAVARIDPNLGQRTNWFNLYGDQVARVFIRQEKGNEKMAWRSDPLPDAARVLAFSGGLGWIGQPVRNGFSLELGNGEVISFDVTKQICQWQSRTGKTRLIYLPTWRSDQDSAGVFFVIAETPFAAKKPVSFVLRSDSLGSLRWFGLDVEQDVKRDLKDLKNILVQRNRNRKKN